MKNAVFDDTKIQELDDKLNTYIKKSQKLIYDLDDSLLKVNEFTKRLEYQKLEMNSIERKINYIMNQSNEKPQDDLRQKDEEAEEKKSKGKESSKKSSKKSNKSEKKPKSIEDDDEDDNEEVANPNPMKKDSDKRKKEAIEEEQKPKTEPIKAKSPIKGSNIQPKTTKGSKNQEKIEPKAAKRKISDESDDD